MGFFRFRRTMKIFPGVTLNFNKKSVGVTTGVRGAKASVNSKGQTTTTVGAPGTGLSYTNRGSLKTKTNGKLPKKKDLHDIIVVYQSFAVVADKLGVSTSTVRTWCTKLGLPTRISDYPDR